MRTLFSILLWGVAMTAMAQWNITKVARNAVRIQYSEGNVQNDLPDWLYVKHGEVKDCDVQVQLDDKRKLLTLRNKKGEIVFQATRHQMADGEATMAFATAKDECLFGLDSFRTATAMCADCRAA